MKITRQSNNQWHYRNNEFLIKGDNKDSVLKVARALKNAQEEDEDEEEKTPEEMLDSLIQKAQELEEIEDLDPEIVKELLDEVHELKEILELEPEEQAERIDELEEAEKHTELEERRKDETDGEPNEDIDPIELKKRRRLESDFKRQWDTPSNTDERNRDIRNKHLDPETAKMGWKNVKQSSPHQSVLEYHVGSLDFQKQKEDGDKFMRKITEGIEEFEDGDSFLKDLGCGN